MKNSLLKRIGTIIGTIAPIAWHTAYSQELAQQIKSQSKLFETQFPTEKAYLQLDKDIYVPGETIWMKGNVFEGVNHLLSSLSKVLYVELIGPNGVLIEQLKLYIASGEAMGEFILGDTVAVASKFHPIGIYCRNTCPRSIRYALYPCRIYSRPGHL